MLSCIFLAERPGKGVRSVFCFVLLAPPVAVLPVIAPPRRWCWSEPSVETGRARSDTSDCCSAASLLLISESFSLASLPNSIHWRKRFRNIGWSKYQPKKLSEYLVVSYYPNLMIVTIFPFSSCNFVYQKTTSLRTSDLRKHYCSRHFGILLVYILIDIPLNCLVTLVIKMSKILAQFSVRYFLRFQDFGNFWQCARAPPSQQGTVCVQCVSIGDHSVTCVCVFLHDEETRKWHTRRASVSSSVTFTAVKCVLASTRARTWNRRRQRNWNSR